MAILYTEAQVENALVRGMVAMYLISQTIQNGFYYMYSPIYRTYKDLQYDIYILTTTISDETPYVTYNPTPTTYETQFYELVGSLINKTKQFDVYGQFDGSVNPNFQPTGNTVINITNTVDVNATKIPFTDATEIILSDFQSTYAPLYGDNATVSIWVANGDGTYSQDNGTAPTITFLGGDIRFPDTYTWGYGVPTTGYIQISGFVTT